MAKPESMNPVERVSTLLNRGRIDRVPVWLWMASPGFAVKNVGYSQVDCWTDPEKNFWSQVWTTEMYGSDNIPMAFFAGSREAKTAFGGEIKWPTSEYEQAPSITRYPVESETDAYELNLPEDVKTAGDVPLCMQFAKLQDSYGLPIITINFSSPLETVRNICGLDTLCRWSLTKPDLVHHLLRIATDYSLKVAHHWVRIFPPQRIMAITGLPTSSNQVMSPKSFEKFVLPYQKELHEGILGEGVKHILCHICGDQNLNLPFWTQIPMGDPGIASFGHEVDLTTAIKHLGETCIILGNIDTSVIQLGPPQQVYELCKQAIKEAKHAPSGFILGPGCSLPPFAPPHNVYMMKKAVSDSGWYE